MVRITNCKDNFVTYYQVISRSKTQLTGTLPLISISNDIFPCERNLNSVVNASTGMIFFSCEKYRVNTHFFRSRAVFFLALFFTALLIFDFGDLLGFVATLLHSTSLGLSKNHPQIHAISDTPTHSLANTKTHTTSAQPLIRTVT